MSNYKLSKADWKNITERQTDARNGRRSKKQGSYVATAAGGLTALSASKNIRPSTEKVQTRTTTYNPRTEERVTSIKTDSKHGIKTNDVPTTQTSREASWVSNKKGAWKSGNDIGYTGKKLFIAGDKRKLAAVAVPAAVTAAGAAHYAKGSFKERYAEHKIKQQRKQRAAVSKMSEETKKDAKYVAGTAAVGAGAIYGHGVVTAGRAVRNASRFTPKVARLYNEAAAKASGPPSFTGMSDLPAAKKEQLRRAKKFAKETPGGKEMKETANRWEGMMRENRKIRESKEIKGNVKNVVIHPWKTRRYSDRKIIDTALGEAKPVKGELHRGDVKPPSGRRYTSYTGNRDMAEVYAQGKRASQANPLTANLPRTPKGTPRVYSERGVRAVRLSPVSRMVHDEYVGAGA